MKFNRSQIMKEAWNQVKRYGWSMKDALRIAWANAKDLLPIHKVFAQNIRDEQPVMIAEGLTFDQASEFKWHNRFRFDHVWVTRLG